MQSRALSAVVNLYVLWQMLPLFCCSLEPWIGVTGWSHHRRFDVKKAALFCPPVFQIKGVDLSMDSRDVLLPIL